MPIALAFAAFVTTLLGGIVAQRVQDRRHIVLGAAAGVMLGVVAFDLVPEGLELSADRLLGVPVPMVTMAAGFLLVHVVERSLAVHEVPQGHYAGHAHRHAGVGLGAGSALVVHSFIDGTAIGAAFQSGQGLGLTVAIAVIAHDFTDGFNTFTLTTLYGNARRLALTLVLLDAVAPLAGAALTLLVHIPEPMLAGYLGFFAGFLLYLATADILPEAHTTDHPTSATLLATVGGTLFMWLVIGLTAHTP
ncbi:divalent cation transporter [Sphaerisporangium rufum]|uniref:Divalent cation transporter n=1 Tax=Sphaerisporangium rufum TaxID=1381558 RepID=A0A919V2K9_9ACTN|nr:ZIP family metal transporter [Sphaerisporangium rufum]GII79078.1 divalent cation transporter [Sphaerisporangium rufum]